MLGWFRQFSTALREEDVSDPRAPRSILSAAVERSAGVGFCSPNVEGIPAPTQGAIEALERDCVLIQLPASGGDAPRVGERVLMSIDAKPGFEVGETIVLGTWERVDGAIRRRGIRVSIPPLFSHLQRRERHRLSVAFDLSPRAQLLHASDNAVSLIAHADVLDICESGARLRVKLPQELPEALTASRLIRIEASFPPPFPALACTAEIMHTRFGGVFVGHFLGVRFEKPSPEISRAIHDWERRRARRNRR